MSETNIDGFMGRMPYTSATWRRCRIWLRTTAAPRCVEADVIGAVGVHVAPYYIGGVQAFSITHIPTGRSIMDGTERDARAVAEALASVAQELNTVSAGKARRVLIGLLGI